MKAIQRTPLAIAALLCCHVLAHATQPSGAKVVNGSATVNSFGNGLQVINSPGAIIEWGSFSIGAGQTVRFDQLTANSAVLNRVTGNRASEIFGTLQSNGRVFLINPNGLLFGKGSKVDTAGFVASALDLSNEDFLSGNYRFKCANSVACEAGVDVLNPINGRIVLQDGSEITTRQAGNGGQVWLIARDRITSEKGSKIDTPGGQVIAATAREVSVTSSSLGQMRFTLTGTTNTRIDLAGDIDVARGAAGFFADTVRLAGKVSALSEKGAAGQIVAQAATDILVEGDARLNVSGIDGADAGAVRLSAGRTIKVAASTEIAADGATSTDTAPGGLGGLIDFRAAEVSLPSTDRLLFASPNVHALGYGNDGLELSRFGRIQVTETGTFTTQVFSGPSWHSESDSFYSYAAGSQGKDNNWSVGPAIPSADGQYLVLSQENRVVGSRTNDGIENTVSGVTWQAQILASDGSLVSTIKLVDMSASGQLTGYYGVQSLALGKGGWVVQEAYNRLHFISAQGALTTVDLSAPIVDLKALLGGGLYVALQDGPESREVRVYSATGALLPDQNAALRNENLTRLPYAYGTVQNNNCFNCVLPDPRQGLRPEASSLLQQLQPGQAIEVLDLPTGSVAFSHGTVPINGGVMALTQAGAIVGFASGDDVYKGSMKLQSGDTSEALPFNSDFTSSSTNNVIPGKGGTVTELQKGLAHSAAPISSHTFAITSEATERNGTYTFTPQGDVRHTNVSRDSTLSLVKRTLQAPTLPATDVAGAVFAPALLGIAPGQRNGMVVPPIDTSTGSGSGSSGSANSGSGSGSSGRTASSTGPIGLSLPPPPAPITPPKSPNASNKPGSGVEASVITNPSADGGRQELLDAAADVVEHELGKAMADKFREAKTPEERGIILQEAADAEVLGRELYDIVKDMDPEMSDALFEGWSVLQQAGLEQEPGVSEGLLNALTIKRDGGTNEDGSPGVARTALEVPLGILRAEMHQAKTPEEKARVRNLMTRELLLAAREEAGKEADDTADVVLTDVAGKKTRITPKGDLIRE